ncbi:hypothetical protein [Arenimonas fontis]|uniref:Uncharacterized protein n=1 Tax=Arenimonas fontis TaxID=2608255 RepID=A0A5B2ZAV6_9GAMM|nr:hypothetical protein [Arenimonas fontis]KAA2284281.1 hypothetical protein F0415_10325 [Arenimonas fontis]
MKRLLAATAVLLLAGCATYSGGGHYHGAYHGHGDYYVGYDYADYDRVHWGFGYGYGVAPFWRLDRYRCGYWPYHYCHGYWRPYSGWHFSIGYWDPYYWGGYGWHGGYWYHRPPHYYWRPPPSARPAPPRRPPDVRTPRVFQREELESPRFQTERAKPAPRPPEQWRAPVPVQPAPAGPGKPQMRYPSLPRETGHVPAQRPVQRTPIRAAPEPAAWSGPRDLPSVRTPRPASPPRPVPAPRAAPAPAPRTAQPPPSRPAASPAAPVPRQEVRPASQFRSKDRED